MSRRALFLGGWLFGTLQVAIWHRDAPLTVLLVVALTIHVASQLYGDKR